MIKATGDYGFYSILKKYSLYCNYYKYDVIDYKGMIYAGILDKGKPNIGGALYNENGNVYKGGFENGEMNGDGELTEYLENSKNIYKGQFLKGKKNGKGIEKYNFILTKYGKNYNQTNIVYDGTYKEDYIIEKENYMRKKLKIIIRYMKENLNLENMMVKEYTMSMIG